MLNYLKQEANRTYTENGAVTNRSTGSELLDLFATVGALRRENEQEITDRFLRAWTEDRVLALKLLFYARDIRGGSCRRRPAGPSSRTSCSRRAAAATRA